MPASAAHVSLVRRVCKMCMKVETFSARCDGPHLSQNNGFIPIRYESLYHNVSMVETVLPKHKQSACNVSANYHQTALQNQFVKIEFRAKFVIFEKKNHFCLDMGGCMQSKRAARPDPEDGFSSGMVTNKGLSFWKMMKDRRFNTIRVGLFISFIYPGWAKSVKKKLVSI